MKPASIPPSSSVTEAYFHPYTRDTKLHIQSVAKSVIGMLVGPASTTEHIKDVDVNVIDYPYSLTGMMVLGDLGESEFPFKFIADKLEVTVEQLVFGGEPIVIEGARKAEK